MKFSALLFLSLGGLRLDALCFKNRGTEQTEEFIDKVRFSTISGRKLKRCSFPVKSLSIEQELAQVSQGTVNGCYLGLLLNLSYK